MVNGAYGSVIQDINSQKIEQSYNAPIYTISQDGKYGLSLNFSRLQRFRFASGHNDVPKDNNYQSNSKNLVVCFIKRPRVKQASIH